MNNYHHSFLRHGAETANGLAAGGAARPYRQPAFLAESPNKGRMVRERLLKPIYTFDSAEWRAVNEFTSRVAVVPQTCCEGGSTRCFVRLLGIPTYTVEAVSKSQCWLFVGHGRLGRVDVSPQ